MRVVGNFDPEFSTENDVRKSFDHLGQEVIRHFTVGRGESLMQGLVALR